MTLVIGIIIFCAIEAIVVGSIVIGAVRMTWGPLQQRYPGCEPQADAISRNFQSFRFGPVNLGYMVHVSVDEGHLHLHPAAFIRRLGARPVSVPWGSVKIKKRSRNGKWIDAAIDGRPVKGPAWCLELAES
jgi:hypothetical protein